MAVSRCSSRSSSRSIRRPWRRRTASCRRRGGPGRRWRRRRWRPGPCAASASFSSRGSALSMVWMSARISSVLIVSMSSRGRDLAVDVHHVRVGEGAHHLADRARLADVGEERVAPALALGRAPDQAGDVDERHRRRDDLLRVEHLGQPVQPRVGQADHADVGLDRGERVVRGEHVVLGQRVEQGALADVGQADDADGEWATGPSMRLRRAACGAAQGSTAESGALPVQVLGSRSAAAFATARIIGERARFRSTGFGNPGWGASTTW